MITVERAQTILYGLMMTLLGFWFGTNYTGRLAYQPEPVENPLLNNSTQSAPAWVGTVNDTNMAVLALAGVCLVGVLALDYYHHND